MPKMRIQISIIDILWIFKVKKLMTLAAIVVGFIGIIVRLRKATYIAANNSQIAPETS